MYIYSFCSRQYLCSDPTEITFKPHHPRGAVQLSFKVIHSEPDLLPTTTPEKEHRAGSTSVYSLCFRHSWEDWTVAAAEKIWMP